MIGNNTINARNSNININNIIKNNIGEKPIFILADDCDIILESAKKMLQKVLQENNLDYNIVQASDGLDIIKIIMAYESSYHLIKGLITDENMEYFNGSDAIKFIRKFEKINKKEHINIISLTSQEDIKLVNHLLKDGADKVISKPITISLLRSLFVSWECIIFIF